MKTIDRFQQTRLFFLACAMVLTIVAACKKDGSTRSSSVELLSFGPSGVKHGEEIRFIGNNLDQVTSIEFVGATVPSSAFTSQQPEQIVLVVPTAAERGQIILKTPSGDIISKSPLNLEVPVVISSVTGSARPGDNISIKGEFVNWITAVVFSNELTVTEFVSKSINELVVTVPIEAQTGPLSILTGGTEPLEIETEEPLIVSLPKAAKLSPIPVGRGANLTITGENLDLVGGVLFKGINEPVTEFVSQSANELVVVVPENTNKGKITLVARSAVEVESDESLSLVGDLPDLDPLSYAFYTDALQGSWQNWGWGSTVDFGNTENVRDGEASIKISYTGSWGALQFKNASVPTASYAEVTFSVYGTTGTDGKQINVSATGGPAFVVVIEEGKWVEYKVPKALLGNPAAITDLTFQETGWAGVVYMDHIGLR